MYTSDYCNGCEMFEVTFITKGHVVSFNELPNTFDLSTGKYKWTFNDVLGYLLIPRSISGMKVHAELYLCVDELDAQTVDLLGYARGFLEKHILPGWDVVKSVHLSQPSTARPKDVACRRAKQLQHMK